MAHLASGAVQAAQEGWTEFTNESRQEVAPVEIYVNERPVATPAVFTPAPAVRVIPAADAAWLPRVHQVLAHVECQALSSAGSNGTSGFTGKGVQVAAKRADVRGVPPRERPV